jgi:hypothetical protein
MTVVWSAALLAIEVHLGKMPVSVRGHNQIGSGTSAMQLEAMGKEEKRTNSTECTETVSTETVWLGLLYYL